VAADFSCQNLSDHLLFFLFDSESKDELKPPAPPKTLVEPVPNPLAAELPNPPKPELDDDPNPPPKAPGAGAVPPGAGTKAVEPNPALFELPNAPKLFAAVDPPIDPKPEALVFPPNVEGVGPNRLLAAGAFPIPKPEAELAWF